MGPKDPRSTVLTAEEEAIAVAFRRHTLLPLDDCLYALQATIPHLTRSSLHRLFQRHDISRLPAIETAHAELRRLRQLEDENARLKQVVADLTLDKQMLQDVLKKKL